MQWQAGCWIFGGALSALKKLTHSHMHLYIGTHNSCGEISYGRGWLTEMAHSSL